MDEMELTISYVALFAGIASIILAIIAIWLAIAFKKQSDDINRDTTEKLAKIEAFAMMTKEDTFGELSKWMDYARKGGVTGRGEEKETLEKLKQELQEATKKEIDNKIALVEKKIEQSLSGVTREASIADSAVLEIKREFQNFKEEMSNIQQRNVTQAIGLGKKIRLEEAKNRLSSGQKKMLKTMLDNPKLRLPDLEAMGYDRGDYIKIFVTLVSRGFMKWIEKLNRWVFDDSIGEILKP